MYQTHAETLFGHISIHLEVREKYSVAFGVFQLSSRSVFANVFSETHKQFIKIITTVTLFEYLILIISIDFYDSVSLFSLVFVFIESINQTVKQCLAIFSSTSNFVTKTPLRVVFSTLLPVFWKCQTRSFVFDFLRDTLALVFDVLQVCEVVMYLTLFTIFASSKILSMIL